MEMVKMLEMRELTDRLNKASDAYYNDNPIMSDKEWDNLFDQLKKMEEEENEYLPDSPTRKVSHVVNTSLKKVNHEKPMLSADKTKSIDDIMTFCEKAPENNKKVSVSWKEDGLTVVLTYENGKLTRAATRGNGLIGEDVTDNVLAGFDNVPKVIKYKGKVIIRGEGTVSYTDFEQINKRLAEPYKLCRAFAGASTRLLNPEEVKDRHIKLKAFDLVYPEVKTKEEEWQFMEEQGFDCAGHVICDIENVRNVIKSFDPNSIDYPVDGLIIQYNDNVFGNSLGETSHHSKKLIALKWKDETAETIFRGVDFQPTRTGRISMTAVFDPVELDGTTVTRATLHNVDFFNLMKLGEGDRLIVYKANMIIPAIEQNIDKTGTYKLPDTCPVCGGHVITKNANLMCSNAECPAKQIRRMVRFADKDSVNIAGISEKTIEELASHGILKEYKDFFSVKDHHEIEQWEGWGTTSYNNLINEIEKSRQNTTLSRLLIGIGIENVGRHASIAISKYFNGSNERFIKAIEAGFDFTTLPDFGEVSNENIYKYFKNEQNLKNWQELVDICDGLKHEFEEKKDEATNQHSYFAGKTIVVTGTLSHFTRKGINEFIESLNAKAGSSVSAKTDYLVCGESAGSKLEKARKLNVTILTEDQFMEKAQKGQPD